MTQAITFITALLLLASVGAPAYAAAAPDDHAALHATVGKDAGKAGKEARKEAKKLAKEGWKTAPGLESLENQLENSYRLQNQLDPKGYPAYFTGQGGGTGAGYDAAKRQALALARQNVARQLQSDLEAITRVTSDANAELTARDIVMRSLGRLTPAVEIYRRTEDGRYEVLLTLAYSRHLLDTAIDAGHSHGTCTDENNDKPNQGI